MGMKSNGFRIILALGSLGAFSACGIPTASVSLKSAQKVDPKALYDSMTQAEYSVTFDGLIGASHFQKQSTDTLCRKTGPSVPNPVYSYKCWKLGMMGGQAEGVFNTIASQNHFTLTIGDLVGTGFEEARTNDESVLCQKITPTYPDAVSIFSCFQKL
ncbi:MAG: hypothetical protein JNL01_12500 [Bdellovibrionales bacterium]|nr:hypothetical protein [Bdellovibrionales bacterium]